MVSAAVTFLSATAAGFSTYTLAQVRLEIANVLLRLQTEVGQLRLEHAEAYGRLSATIPQQFLQLKTEITQAHSAQNLELREWISLHFVRRQEMETLYQLLEERLRGPLRRSSQGG